MAIALGSIIKSAEKRPPIICVYGVGGIGKTTFASQSDKPIFVCVEDGLGVIDVPHFPVCKTFNEVIEALEVLAAEKHSYKTAVIDSLDWLERLVVDHVCKMDGKSSLSDFEYGRGYIKAADTWRQILDILSYLRDSRQMTVISIAHSTIKTFSPPELPPYERYQLKLDEKRVAPLVVEHADVVLFANYKVDVRSSTGAGFNKKNKAYGTGERRVFTVELPSHVAKNRFAMDEVLPLDWNAVAEQIPWFQTTDKQTADKQTADKKGETK